MEQRKKKEEWEKLQGNKEEGKKEEEDGEQKEMTLEELIKFVIASEA